MEHTVVVVHEMMNLERQYKLFQGETVSNNLAVEAKTQTNNTLRFEELFFQSNTRFHNR